MQIGGREFPKETEERLLAMLNVPTVTSLGIELVNISPEGEVVCTMDSKDQLNAVGFAHGGATFTLADQAFALASNLTPDVQVAMFASINYIRPGRGLLKAVARKVGETNRTSLFEVRVFEGDELIAMFQGTAYKLRRK